MIQANELRLGNLVYFTGNGNNNICPVTELWRNELEVSYVGNSLCLKYDNEDLQPIPLTPELLEKCGFVKDGYEDAVWYQRQFPVIGELCTSDRLHPLGNFVFDTDTDTLKIFYLHQLQNLYHSLTGKELNIKL
jgi:hypothetical protein